MSVSPPVDYSVYLVTDSALAAAQGRDVVQTVELAVAGGVTAVQIREKHATARSLLSLVRQVAEILPPHVALFVNDRIDVFCAARDAGARVTGVHVGQGDMRVETVRSLIGPDAVIGLSASTPEELMKAAESEAVDYVGIGAVHTTSTKSDAPEAIGIAGFARRAALAGRPAIGIGGIQVADMPLLRQAGAAGGAVVSAIMSAASPQQTAAEFVRAWRGVR